MRVRPGVEYGYRRVRGKGNVNMDEQYLKAMHPVTAVLHWKILSILQQYDIKTVLDVGGIGKLNKLSDYDVTNANLARGIDGCNLPYDDESFDAVISVATLEHVHDQAKFLDECERVSRRRIVHWFPCGPYAEDVERLKKKYGHWHPCIIPYLDDIQAKPGIEYDSYPFTHCGLHLLLCMTLTPSLKAPEVYDFIIQSEYDDYGLMLLGAK